LKSLHLACSHAQVRSIGVSNVSAVKLGELLKSCRIKPAVNQVRGLGTTEGELHGGGRAP
jgi:diketogulonate reductase-like aldo/keto reductase